MPRKCGLCKKEGHNRTNCANAHYKGEYNYKGERHGKGIYEYKLSKYRNDWVGFGVYMYNAKYEGEWVEGKREGKGVLTWRYGVKYEGGWKNDKQWGKGIMTYPNGDKYECDWVDDKIGNIGIMTYVNGDKYDGKWQIDPRRGSNGLLYRALHHTPHYRYLSGTIYYNNGDIYKGTNLRNGKYKDGIIIYANGEKVAIISRRDSSKDKIDSHGIIRCKSLATISTKYKLLNTETPGIDKNNLNGYKGEFILKLSEIVTDKTYGCDLLEYKHGQGIMTYASGDKYEGSWKEDKYQGNGVKTRSNGDKYEGEWNDGQRTRGVYTFANGDIYDGEYKVGNMHGRGVYTNASGDKYDGFWQCGVKHGKGVKTSKDGYVFKGVWRNDLIWEGNGIIIYDDGIRYDGEYKRSHRNGRGVMIYKNGDKYDGLWNNNKQYGRGVMIYKNGDKYDGSWGNNKQYGRGVMIYKNGDKYDGSWNNNKRDGRGIMTYSNGEIYEGKWNEDKKDGRFLIFKEGDYCAVCNYENDKLKKQFKSWEIKSSE